MTQVHRPGVTAALARWAVPAAIAFVLIVYAGNVQALFFRLPTPWPDEPLFADAATRLLREGRLATPLLEEVFTGGAAYTYWMPPVYFVSLAAVFAVTGPEALPMRAFSVAASLVVLALTYVISRRAGLARPAAVLAVALLSLDVVFVRGALMGRPDMLALALAMAAVTTSIRPVMSPRTAAASAMLASLAALTHPFALVTFVALAAAVPRGGARAVAGAAAGAAVPAAAWALYALAAPNIFLAQLGEQLARKTEALPLGHRAELMLLQYGGGDWHYIVVVILLVSLVGLLAATRRRRANAPLVAYLVTAAGLAVVVTEMWYPVYATPVAYVGVGAALHEAGARGVRALLSAAIAAAIVFVLVLDVALLASPRRYDYEDDPATLTFEQWSDEVSAALPPNSRVLMLLIPDPWFRLRDRPDLVIRHLHETPANTARYGEIARRYDLIVVTAQRDSPARRVAREHAELIAEVRQAQVSTEVRPCFAGGASPCPYIAEIYRVRK